MSPIKRFSFDKWIAQYTAQYPLRAKSLVMTLFGDAITPHGGHVWMGSLIELLAPFGISDRLVRTSAFRLSEEGWLDAQREGRRSVYALNERSAARFERAYQRVYSPTYKEWDATWTVLFTANTPLSAQQRAQLRKELDWQGFGTIAQGVYIHPASDTDTLTEMIARIGLDKHVFIATATSSGLPVSLPLDELISQCWALDNIIDSYAQYVHAFVPVLSALTHQTITLNAAQAFMIRTLAIHHFRRIQLHDPQLPLTLLPTTWPGKTAYELCRDIYQCTFEKAESYIVDTLRHEDETTPIDAAPYFYHRFGGLVSD
jgi:phenylacetic acid degradation operon negative regulatory protein